MTYRPLVTLASIAQKARLGQSRLIVRRGSEQLAKLPAKSAVKRT